MSQYFFKVIGDVLVVSTGDADIINVRNCLWYSFKVISIVFSNREEIISQGEVKNKELTSSCSDEILVWFQA